MIYDKTITKDSPIQLDVEKHYENCTLKGIDFSQISIDSYKFIDCTFEECNLSSLTLGNTSFVSCHFEGCKMLGLIFENCYQIAFFISCTSCNLTSSSFYKMNLKGMKLIDCRLHDVDFQEANMTQATFTGSDLLNARFERTVLEKADMRSCENVSFSLNQNKVKKLKLDREILPNLLLEYQLDIK